MALMPDEEVESILARSGPRPPTPKTITDLPTLRAKGATARQDGCALALEEGLLDEIMLAAVVHDRQRRPIAVIHIAAYHRGRARPLSVRAARTSSRQAEARAFGRRTPCIPGRSWPREGGGDERLQYAAARDAGGRSRSAALFDALGALPRWRFCVCCSMENERMITRRALGFAAAVAAASPAFAQTGGWPSRPVRVIVPYGAGGATDTLCRLFCARLSAVLSQPFPVENRPGGNAVLGAEAVLRARDGHTMLFAGPGVFSATPKMQSVSYDPLRDFMGVNIVGSNGILLVVNKEFPPSTLPELVAWARANPGRLNTASSSLGTSSHLAPFTLATAAGIELTIVPYPGVPQIVADLVSGRVHAHFGSPADMLQLVQSGAVKAIALTGAHRVPQLPDVPTIAETFPGAIFTTWNGMFAPAGTPPQVVSLLSGHMLTISREPEVLRRLADLGIEPDARTPEEVDATIRQEGKEYERLLRAAGVLRAG
nr:tripartite tricarboxylate transporter substrate-binding protein [Roseomonas marmotae]